MGLSEPVAWTQEREARMQQQYPQLSVGSPSDLLNVDRFNVERGQAPSQFSQNVMNLANFATQSFQQDARQGGDPAVPSPRRGQSGSLLQLPSGLSGWKPFHGMK